MNLYLAGLLLVLPLASCSRYDAAVSEQIIPEMYQKCQDNGGLKAVAVTDRIGWPEEQMYASLVHVDCHNGATFEYQATWRLNDEQR